MIHVCLPAWMDECARLLFAEFKSYQARPSNSPVSHWLPRARRSSFRASGSPRVFAAPEPQVGAASAGGGAWTPAPVARDSPAGRAGRVKSTRRRERAARAAGREGSTALRRPRVPSRRTSGEAGAGTRKGAPGGVAATSASTCPGVRGGGGVPRCTRPGRRRRPSVQVCAPAAGRRSPQLSVSQRGRSCALARGPRGHVPGGQVRRPQTCAPQPGRPGLRAARALAQVSAAPGRRREGQPPPGSAEASPGRAAARACAGGAGACPEGDALRSRGLAAGVGARARPASSPPPANTTFYRGDNRLSEDVP